MLQREQIESTAAWIAAHQEATGEIAWWRGGKMDPWDHVHAAMGLTVAGYRREAAAAYRFLAGTQLGDGSWPAERQAGQVSDVTRESNHAAYFVTGVWHYYWAARDARFAAEMWPVVEKALGFVLRLRDESGAFSWAVSPSGNVWRAPLLTGSSSIHGSLVCAVRLAERMGYERPHWDAAREQLADVLQNRIERFDAVDLPEPPGRYAMDWYYPVLGGALRGADAHDRLLDQEMIDKFIAEGVGCRCVSDAPWYTVAESCELAIAFDACGLTHRAQRILSWMRAFRRDDGSYWTGKTYPEDVFWPAEPNTWTAATVLLADDALSGRSRTSAFFRSLARDGLGRRGIAIAS